jgi:hypothetical protein
MKNGERVAPAPALAEIRTYCLEQLAALPESVKQILEPGDYSAVRSDALLALAEAAYAKRGGAQ